MSCRKRSAYIRRPQAHNVDDSYKYDAARVPSGISYDSIHFPNFSTRVVFTCRGAVFQPSHKNLTHKNQPPENAPPQANSNPLSHASVATAACGGIVTATCGGIATPTCGGIATSTCGGFATDTRGGIAKVTCGETATATCGGVATATCGTIANTACGKSLQLRAAKSLPHRAAKVLPIRAAESLPLRAAEPLPLRTCGGVHCETLFCAGTIASVPVTSESSGVHPHVLAPPLAVLRGPDIPRKKRRGGGGRLKVRLVSWPQLENEGILLTP